jgi:hypothetical protein
MADGPKISIIVVNFNAEKLLKECLDSLCRETQDTSFDVWMVDNNSHDESVSMVRENFPEVNLIENDDNLGFSKANNQALTKSASDYILLLNPDTVVRDRAIDKMVAFMDAHPDVGISGCRVLNKDGSLQPACRRSVPTPKVAFYHLSGLSRLFPNSMIMAKYNLTYLDPDQSHEVDAVSGAFLLIRRAVVDQIGLLDERFFIYGEDVDWCVRAKQAGWKVIYHPEAEILHYKGGCSANSRRTAYEFYRAMYLFHRKHFAKNHSPVTNLLICTGIVIRAMFSWRRFFASAKAGPGG